MEHVWMGWGGLMEKKGCFVPFSFSFSLASPPPLIHINHAQKKSKHTIRTFFLLLFLLFLFLFLEHEGLDDLLLRGRPFSFLGKSTHVLVELLFELFERQAVGHTVHERRAHSYLHRRIAHLFSWEWVGGWVEG